MDPITRMVAAGAAGAAGGSSATYVDDVFSTTLYTSNASSNFDGTEQVITTGIDHTEGFLTWIKDRDTANDHVLFDSERIGTNYKWIYSNDDKTEQDTADIFKNPTSTGFTVKQATSGSGTGRTNPSGSKSMSSWTFRKAPGFFDVVTYTGSGSPQTIPHNLDSVPGMIIVKCTSHGSTDWTVFHRETGHPAFSNGGSAYATFLNNTVVADPSAAYWDNTVPTSTVFTVGVGDKTNGDGKTYVAYLFAHDDARFGTNEDESIIKCGKFTVGSGSLTVDLGFEPQWVMIKRTSGATGSWVIRDVMRGWNKKGFNRLFADSDQTENTVNDSSDTYFPIYNTGFGSTSDWLSGNSDYIYVAIRRPNKPPTDATEVFAVNTRSGNETAGTLSTAGFPVDLAIISARNVAHWTNVFDRLRGPLKFLATQVTNAESTYNNTLTGFDNNTAIEIGTDSTNLGVNRNSQTYVDFLFKRAPGFFDVVAYNGTGSTTAHNHNLGVTPELLIVKNRSHPMGYTFLGWPVYNSADGASEVMQLNATDYSDIGNSWAHTAPTSTTFTTGTGAALNSSGATYVAYLFASLAGISKVGTYTGTGSAINVDCGFTAGARFVMIKRRDTAADWYVWDSTRGIVSGNDPYLRFNSTDEETTNTDYIDPLNAGFTVTASGQGDLNADGGTYLFLAIA